MFLLAAAGTSRAQVKKIKWGPGRPPHWQEEVVTSANRVEARVAVPSGHDFITAVVEDKNGKRVRNLLAQVAVNDLGISPTGTIRTACVVWDGLTDEGTVAPEGIYYIRGVTIPRPRILYDYSFYNPNSLPWQGYTHSGWGADHAGPSDIACAPLNATDRTEVVISCAIAETPHAVFGLDGSHNKIWGYKREGGINGINCVAFADGFLWMGFKDSVIRLDPDSQRDIGWKRPAGRAASTAMTGDVRRIAVGPEYGAVLVQVSSTADMVVFLDKQSGTSRQSRNYPAEVGLPWKAHDLVYMNDGRLLVSGDAGVFTVTTNGPGSQLALPGCVSPRQLATDASGNLYVFDAGPDWQVKIYGPDMTLVRTVGHAGGQKVYSCCMFTTVATNATQGLDIDYDAFRTVGGMDVDRNGNLWVTESMHPRMVTVWNSQGKRVETFVGNTEYGGACSSLHEQDPSLAYGYGMIFPIAADRTVPHNPSRFAASAVTAEPASLRLPGLAPGHYFKSGRLFRSNVSGRMCEYFVHNDYGYPVLYINRNGDYRPCAAAVKVAGRDAGSRFAKPESVSANTDWYGVWSDRNSDGLVQSEEVFPLPEAGGRILDFYGMGYVFNPYLTWYLGAYAVAPSGYQDDGTPIYDTAGMRKLNDANLALRTGNYLVGDLCNVFQTGCYRFADSNGNVFATYPLNAMGVHSSQAAPPPGPGETRGELCYAGVATMAGELGPIVASQGNYGQMFIFTGDGLYVCGLFKDTRHGPKPWPPEARKGTDFTDCSMGQEPFNGCMVVQDDKKMRVVFGRTAANVCVVEGLELARRFGPIPVRFMPSDRSADSQQTADATAAAVPLIITRTPALGKGAIIVDGSLDDWADVPARKIMAGENELASVRVVYTGSNLLLAVSVRDETPMVNGFTDWRSAFRSGDAIDLYMGQAGARADATVEGDVRMLIVPSENGAVVVRYRPVVSGIEPEKRVPFTSPIGTTYIDEVKMTRKLDVVFKKTGDGYICEAALPWSLLGIEPEDGKTVAGDIGVLTSDGGGQQTMARNYLFNRTWTITSDLRSEAMLQPSTWGKFELK